MINLYQYESPQAQKLPRDFISSLLDKLTAEKQSLIKEALQIQRMSEGKMKENRKKWYEKHKLMHEGTLETLSAIGLHAVWSWAGHRDQYIFPTYADCEMQEDWLWQCTD